MIRMAPCEVLDPGIRMERVPERVNEESIDLLLNEHMSISAVSPGESRSGES